MNSLGSVHYLGAWEEYRIPREGYRIPDTSDGRGRELSIYQMGGAGMNQYDVYVCICLFDLAYHLRLLYFYYPLIMN